MCVYGACLSCSCTGQLGCAMSVTPVPGRSPRHSCSFLCLLSSLSLTALHTILVFLLECRFGVSEWPCVPWPSGAKRLQPNGPLRYFVSGTCFCFCNWRKLPRLQPHYAHLPCNTRSHRSSAQGRGEVPVCTRAFRLLTTPATARPPCGVGALCTSLVVSKAGCACRPARQRVAVQV